MTHSCLPPPPLPPAPLQVEITCSGINGTLHIADQVVVCHCSDCKEPGAGGQRTFSGSQFEIHSGSGSAKKWRVSFKIRPGTEPEAPPGSNLPLNRWLEMRGIVMAHKPGHPGTRMLASVRGHVRACVRVCVCECSGGRRHRVSLVCTEGCVQIQRGGMGGGLRGRVVIFLGSHCPQGTLEAPDPMHLILSHIFLDRRICPPPPPHLPAGTSSHIRISSDAYGAKAASGKLYVSERLSRQKTEQHGGAEGREEEEEEEEEASEDAMGEGLRHAQPPARSGTANSNRGAKSARGGKDLRSGTGAGGAAPPGKLACNGMVGELEKHQEARGLHMGPAKAFWWVLGCIKGRTLPTACSAAQLGQATCAVHVLLLLQAGLRLTVTHLRQLRGRRRR